MNQNYNFVQGLFSQVMNGKNEALATKKSTSFKGFLLMIVFALFATISMQGQVAVTVANRTNTTPNLAASYPTLASALTDLNAVTAMSGPVTLNLAAGSEVAPSSGFTIGSATLNPVLSSTNKVTLSATPGTVTLNAGVGTVLMSSTAATPVLDGIMKICGADWITIDGLTLTDGNAVTDPTAMMEFGLAIFKASATDGASNNTIKNCTINLPRENNTGGNGVFPNGSICIAMVNSIATDATTALVITAASGSSSNNNFFTNTTNGGNFGILLAGFLDVSPYAFADTNNNVGGSSLLTGNTVLNFGGTLASGNSIAGIRTNYQYNVNVSYNTVNNNNGSGLNHPSTLRGIFLNTADGATATVNFNTVTLTGGGTTSQLSGIENSAGAFVTGVTNAISITNNTITVNYPTSTSGNSYAVNTGVACNTLNINNNTIVVNTARTSSTHYLINQTGAVVNAININNNTITNNFTFVLTAANTSAHYLIYNTSAAATCALSISGNNFNGSNSPTTSVGGTGTWACIYQSGAPLTSVISNNNFNNLSFKTTGTIYLIYNSNTAPAGGSKLVQNNTVVTGFTRAVASTTSAFYGYYDYGSSPVNITYTVSGNNFSNINIGTNTTGAFYGMYVNDNSNAHGLNFYNNTVSNITRTSSGAAAFYGFYLGGFGGTAGTPDQVYGNTISGCTTTSTSTAQYGFYLTTPALYVNVYNNTIQNNAFNGAAGQFVGIYNAGTSNLNKIYNNTIVNNTSTTTSALAGVMVAGGTQVDVYQNKINTMSSAGSVWGAYVSGGTLVNVYDQRTIGANNYSVFGLTSSGATTVVEGIRAAGGTTVNFYKNNVYGLSNSSASTTATAALVNGISLSAGTTVNAYNNLVSGLTAPTVSYLNAINGINVSSTTATTNYNLFNNTIYLNAAGGTNFGTTGVLHTASATATTATLNLRNNIIVNNSTPSGTGIVTALRRSAAATLGNFATTSNNNMYFAGTPSATRTILYDGTNAYQTYATFIAAVGPTRESASFNDTAFVPASFFSSTTPTDATYLQPIAGTTTLAESGGPAISSFTTDFNDVVRNTTFYDLGAWEFAGVSPAPSIVISTNPATNLCTAVAKTINATITTPSGTITGATLNYAFNGVAQTAITMTNTSGNIWSATVPVASPVNALVTWSITATSNIPLSRTLVGASYQDAPTFGATATATASLGTVCSGSPSILSVNLIKAASISTGTGLSLTSATTQPTAFCNRWSGYRSQTVYTAAELNAMGLRAGNITSMAYNITTLGDAATNAGFTVLMGSTTLSALTTTFESTTGFTTVYPSQTYTHTASGLQVINFTTPYVWDGTSNILINVVHSGANSTNNSITYYTATAGNTVLTATSTTATTGTQSNQRLDLILQGNGAPAPTAYAWSDGTSTVGTTNPLTVNPSATTSYTATVTAAGCPVVSNTVTVTTLPLPTAPTATGSTQCGTLVPAASVAATSGAAGTGTFKWYAAATGGTALQSSTSATYTTAVAATTTFYVSELGANGCESARTPITVTVIVPPTLTLSSAAQAICAGATTVTPVTITSTLSNYDSYSWSPAATAAGTTGTGYLFNPAATTTYVLSASNSVSGCATTASVVVTVNPLPLITSATSSSEPLCLGNSTTLTGVSIPAAPGAVTVGTGTTLTSTSGYPTAFENYFYQNWQQYLFKASELNALGLVAGNINSITFKIAATPSPNTPLADYNVKIGSTPDNFLTGFTTSGLTNVFGPASVTAAVGFNTITFTTPYNWDGFSNIVIDIRQTGFFGNGNATTYYTSTAYNSVLYSYASPSNTSFWTSGPTPTASTSRPNIIFGGQVGNNLTSTVNWTWSPSTALSSTTGNVVTANPTASTVYTVTATNSATTCTSSRPVTVTVLPLPSAPTATNATQCGAQLSTASVTSTTGLTNPVFVWYAAATGGAALQTGTSTTFTTAISSTRTMYVSEYNGSCESLRTPVVMTVNAPPAVTITSSVPTFCGTGGNATLTATSADSAMTYTWTSLNPTATLSATNTAVTTATISETSDFKVTGIAADPSCLPLVSYISVGVYPLPSATVTTTAQGVCPGTSATIGSGLSAGNFTVTCIPSPSAPATAPLGAVSLVGGQALITPYPAGVTASGTSLDDNFWGGIPVGFNFNFFGSNVSTVFIGSNGTINLGTAGSTQYTFTGGFPNTGNPASTVAVVARDLHWGTAGAGKITYWTDGIAPNRRFIVQFLNGNTFSGGGKQTAEAVFYETLGTIDIRVFEATYANAKYIGLQDASQTIGATAPNCDVTPVVNNYWNGQTANIDATAPRTWRFTPPSNYITRWYANNVLIPPATGFGNPGVNVFNLSVAPAVTTTYSITYTNQTTGCSNAAGSAQVLMSVLGNTIPSGLTTIASSTSICTGQTVNFSTSYTGITDGMVFQWQSTIDNGTTWTDIASANALTYSTIPAVPTQYRCKMIACNGVPGYTSPASIGFNNSIVSTTPGLRCGTGTATAGATGSAGTTIKWYANASGGSALGTGTTFTTPSITATTTYYAGAETYVAGALPVGAGGTNSSSSGQSFLPGFWGGSKTQYIIKADELLAAGIGAGNITSLGFEPTDSGQTYQGFSVSLAPVTANVMTTAFVSTGLTQVYAGTQTDNGFTPVANTLNNLTFGTGTGSASSFNWDGSSNILISIARTSVPGAFTSNATTMKVDNVGFVSTAYDLADNLTPAAMLASATADATTSFRPRFTINGQVVCSSVRVPVVVTVTTPPSITLSGDPAVICAESNSTPVTVTAGASNYDSYVWTPTSVTGSVGTGWIFNPLTTTTYTLAAAQTTGATPCATTASITVNVNPTPSVLTISPSPVSTCADTILPLVSSGGTLNNMTLLTQNFNGPNNWTTVNNSTGGSAGPALADWTMQPDGYTYGFYGAFHSNDNSQFYVSNSDAQGSGGTTATELKSPVFSTIGFSVANLSFYHHLYFPTTANVEYTINGGATWVTIQSYTTSQGAIAAFTNANLALPAAMLNQPSVQLRFKYDDSWGYFWAIDNVSITGTQVAPMVWSPTTNLYSDAAATVPYAGENLSTVYFKTNTAAASVTYTATATSVLGCARVATVPVVVYQTAAPTGTQFYQFCPTGGATVSSMTPTITGTNIKWYSTSTGGTALAPTTPLTQGYYWASQTANGCESPTRFLVFAISNATVAPSSSPTQQFCNSATVANLTANGTVLQWYTAATGGTALTSATALASGTYYVSQTSGGCESPRTAVSVTVNVVPAPTGAATQSLSSLLTLGDIAVTGSNIVWYASAANAASGTNPLPSTQLLANTTYYATQTINGCRSAASLAVTITTLANQDFDMTQFTYYPNPVIDLLNITYSQDMTSVKVFNMVGQQLMSKQVNSNTVQVDMSRYANGAYFIQVTTENAMKTVRVIKK